MITQILENGRVAVTETFTAELPKLFSHFHWEDGANWKYIDSDWHDHIILFSTNSKFWGTISKDSSQEEINEFIAEITKSKIFKIWPNYQKKSAQF